MADPKEEHTDVMEVATDADATDAGGHPLARPALNPAAPKPNPATARIPADPNDPVFRYKMNYPSRGQFILINNINFAPKTRMNKRSGSEQDGKLLTYSFGRLGFVIEKVHEDKTVDEMLKIMNTAAAADHSNSDCIAVAILSHGDTNKKGKDVVWGYDGEVEIDELVKPFKTSKGLIGKPKLFFFQACRGNWLDHGQDTLDSFSADSDVPDDDTDGPIPIRLPMEADFLYAFSTVSGYYSWRNGGNGSWFMQSVTRNLNEYATRGVDLVRILTRACNDVAVTCESKANEAYMTGKKQMPSIVSMLRKEIYFDQKS